MDSVSVAAGIEHAERYAAERTYRFVVEDGEIRSDALDREQLRTWISGDDPLDGSPRGMDRATPDADLLLDATVNAPKSFSVAAMLDTDLEAAYEAMQDRLRDRIMTMWQSELNTRKGRNGVTRVDLSRIEVVELKHERSRALDPHKHRHLWLSVKVKGEDDQWRRIDSRVAMKFQNVVNAEGDLAARTDPEWVAALAAKGLAIDPVSGEIEQLAHLVRPLSRRANQIEANRETRLAQWREDHPGQEPTPQELAAIDRWAWSHNRPGKPVDLDEAEWASTVRAEISAIDPSVLSDRAPLVGDQSAPSAPVDVALLAARAVVDADQRAMRSGGRFSSWDVRAGAIRAIGTAGIGGDRRYLEQLVDQVRHVAAERFLMSLVDEEAPEHVKVFLSSDVARIKAELADRLAELAVPGRAVEREQVVAIASSTLEDVTLNEGQINAAALIAGTDNLVTVIGAAGAGKTTMLQAAGEVLQRQHRRMIVIAPTRKAASVAGRETGAAATSVHALLLDHGWSSVTDRAGRERWVRTPVGGTLPGFDRPYEGPNRWALAPGDRIVVDEAGMLDADAARVLAIIARETGVGIAMVGDPRQVDAVGVSGAMDLAARSTSANSELNAIHRFRTDTGAVNTAYADLTLRMRAPRDRADALSIAEALVDGMPGAGVRAASSTNEAEQIAVERWLELTRPAGRGQRRRTVAIVTSTNDQAQSINERIQRARVASGALSADTSAEGVDGQLLYVGDIVQTRKNHTGLQVENRAMWRVECIRNDGGVDLVALDRPGTIRQVPAEYLRDNAHLAYASTVHGIQGETVDAAIVLPGVDAAGLYVGMTRGREMNEAITLASSRAGQLDELAATMMRRDTEASIQDAVDAARSDLAQAAKPENMPSPTTTAPPVPPAPWSDRKRRPFGWASDIDDLAATQRQELLAVRTAAAAANDQLHGQRRTLEQLQRQVAQLEARNHGRGGDVDELVDKRALIATLTPRMTTAADDARTAAAEYRRALARLEAVERERSLRARQGADTAAREAAERAQRSTQRRPDNTGPYKAAPAGPAGAPGPRL